MGSTSRARDRRLMSYRQRLTLEFILLHDPRLWREDFAKLEVGGSESIHFAAFDVFANVGQRLGAPLVQLLFVLVSFSPSIIFRSSLRRRWHRLEALGR